jgi:hypothetical protein
VLEQIIFFLKPPLIVRSIVKGGSDGKLKRIVSLGDPSLATICISNKGDPISLQRMDDGQLFQ